MICTKCKDDLPEGQFHWRNRAKQIRHSYCKTCKTKYDGVHHNLPSSKRKYAVQFRARWQRKRDFVRTYLETHGCVDCHESDPVCLDFDHVRGKKAYNICDLVYNSYRLETLQKEIEKCEVRCANCHRKVTRKRERMVGTAGIELTSPVFQAGAKTTSATSPKHTTA
jgi:hypothetical protein